MWLFAYDNEMMPLLDRKGDGWNINNVANK